MWWILHPVRPDYVSLFSVAVMKYLRLGNLYRIAVYLVHGSMDREVQNEVPASGEDLVLLPDAMREPKAETEQVLYSSTTSSVRSPVSSWSPSPHGPPLIPISPQWSHLPNTRCLWEFIFYSLNITGTKRKFEHSNVHFLGSWGTSVDL